MSEEVLRELGFGLEKPDEPQPEGQRPRRR